MVSDFSIVFVGCVESSRVCLLELLKCGKVKVECIFTILDIAGCHADYADLVSVGVEHGVRVHIGNPTMEYLKILKPDLIFVVGWSKIIDRSILDFVPCIGFHPTLLPEGRGRHPLVWTLVKCLMWSGVSFFWINEGVDTGDIIWQKGFEVARDETPKTLYRKVCDHAVEGMRFIIENIDNLPAVPQDDSHATYWRKRTPEEMQEFDYDPL